MCVTHSLIIYSRYHTTLDKQRRLIDLPIVVCLRVRLTNLELLFETRPFMVDLRVDRYIYRYIYIHNVSQLRRKFSGNGCFNVGFFISEQTGARELTL